MKKLTTLIAILMVMAGCQKEVKKAEQPPAKPEPVPVESISLNHSEYTLDMKGGTLFLVATILPSNATERGVTWYSDHPEVATVNSSGRVTAVDSGEATITATTKDQGLTASCLIKVNLKITGIELTPATLSISVGESVDLTADIKPANAYDKTIIWTTLDNSIASVDPNGKVTGNLKGKTTIKATSTDGGNVSGYCEITVSSACPTGAVDLGLTDENGYKVYWGKYNMSSTGFVSSPEEYGDYFAWGETETYYSSLDPLTWKSGKTGYKWESYKWCNGTYSRITKYNNGTVAGPVDNLTTLVTGENGDDVASKVMGDNWRMPTKKEWKALRDNCNIVWTTVSGVNGVKVSAENGNSIFLPAAGMIHQVELKEVGTMGLYWSSTVNDTGTCEAINAISEIFTSSDFYSATNYRCVGLTIRPVSN